MLEGIIGRKSAKAGMALPGVTHSSLGLSLNP
jgi:hypothetical protein